MDPCEHRRLTSCGTKKEAVPYKSSFAAMFTVIKTREGLCYMLTIRAKLNCIFLMGNKVEIAMF